MYIWARTITRHMPGFDEHGHIMPTADMNAHRAHILLANSALHYSYYKLAMCYVQYLRLCLRGQVYVVGFTHVCNVKVNLQKCENTNVSESVTSTQSQFLTAHVY